MSNVASSTVKPNTKEQNSAVTNFDPTLLTALQDIATAYGIELYGGYVKKNAAPLNGDSFKGTFHVRG